MTTEYKWVMKMLLIAALFLAQQDAFAAPCSRGDINARWNLYFSSSAFVAHRQMLIVRGEVILALTTGWREYTDDSPPNLFPIHGGRLFVSSVCNVGGTWEAAAGRNSQTFSIREAKMSADRLTIAGVLQRRTPASQQQTTFVAVRF